MSELIADLDKRVRDEETGEEYFVNVVGAELADGRWEAWIEFVPLSDNEPLLTGTETHQHKRGDIVRWADHVTDVYIQGAFERAAAATEGLRMAITVPATAVEPLVAPAAVDPFELLRASEATLRVELQRLTRAELLAVIDAYNLNPPKHSLARLSDRQLITFIVTATKVQMTGRLD